MEANFEGENAEGTEHRSNDHHLQSLSEEADVLFRILHFNDAYNLLETTGQTACGGIARFVTKINSFSGNCLRLFSGDLWSPSRRKDG